MQGVLYDFTGLIQSIDAVFRASMSDLWATVLEYAIIGIIYLVIYALIGLFLVYAERKVCAFIQVRLGPNRVGPKGFFQTIADFIKLLLKENIKIKNADGVLFNLAPFIVIVASFLTFGTVPFAKGLQGIDLNIGVFFIMAASSMGVVGILLGGWSSNSKYSLIGAMRSGAQIVSYELSVGLSLVTMVILTGTMQLSQIIELQSDGWFIFKGHIPALISLIIMMIAGTAEINRGPFDLAEAESELTAGYHTEYSGIKFAFFYLSEYMNMFVVSALVATVFFGGWMPLHIGSWQAFNHIMDFIPPIIWFILKSFALMYVIMLFKWTFPRLRIDQLLKLEWQYLLPISLFNVLLMAFVVYMKWYF